MRAWKSVAAAALVMAPLAACGSGGSSASGGNTVNWYIGTETWLPDVIKACNAQSHGAFTLQAQSLPSMPDPQREQLVRRLAAKDRRRPVLAGSAHRRADLPATPRTGLHCCAKPGIRRVGEHASAQDRNRLGDGRPRRPPAHPADHTPLSGNASRSSW